MRMVNHSTSRSLQSLHSGRKMWTKFVLLAILAISLLPDQAFSQGFCGLCKPDCAINLGDENRRLSFFNNSLYYLDTLTTTEEEANSTCTSLFSRPAWPGIPGNLANIQSTEELNFINGSGSVVTMDSLVCKIPCSDGIMTQPRPAVPSSGTNIYNINISNNNSPDSELSINVIDHSKDSEENNDIMPDNIECKDGNYQILDEETRSIFAGRGKNFDLTGSSFKSPSWNGLGWYRFEEPAGIKMPETPTAEFKCGTFATGWLDGSHPKLVGQTKDAKFCFSYQGDNCKWSALGEVTNCGRFYVYKLPEVPNSNGLRYCAKSG